MDSTQPSVRAVNTYVPAFIRFQSLVRGYLQKQRYRAMGAYSLPGPLAPTLLC
jgi:hypothetical protein